MPDRDVPRVLVIDDDVRVRHFLTTALGAAGFAVTATGTGEEGLRLAASRPELVVLDVELPDLSGREVCRRLKAAEDTATIPVLMLSGVFTAAVDRSEALEDGSDAYLTKPVTSRELVAMARALLRTARAERRSHEHQRAAEELRRRVAQSKAMVDVAHPPRSRARADAADASDHRGGGLPRGAVGAAAGGRARARRHRRLPRPRRAVFRGRHRYHAGLRRPGGGGAGERRPLPPRLRARREAHDAERADPPHHRCCLQP